MTQPTNSPATNQPDLLDEILTGLDAYKLNGDLITGGVGFSIEEHYVMYPELREAKAALCTYISGEVVEARKDENQSIESMLEDEIADKRDCCYNHDKYSPQCHACKLVKWRKIIAKEYLASVKDRLERISSKGENNV